MHRTFVVEAAETKISLEILFNYHFKQLEKTHKVFIHLHKAK